MSARKNKFDLVFSKFKIGKKTIKNRLIASPISINMADKKREISRPIFTAQNPKSYQTFVRKWAEQKPGNFFEKTDQN